ncbi:uncharacterized protein N7529_002189 [Penicillium soppii]|uniref:uncharacterized protein n=1 Tax=Penicillium soppii TaxID=69789 RepID=UPI0025475CDE|nr:uncharacterized protein N7529_002189 [Penicillium soppii]KAJ5873759.1 hypothetical protein N7529_002189 [Penicillium soppii]
MNYTRMLDKTSTNKNLELSLLLSFLGWARNDAFARVADVCALWGAIVDANTHLMKLDALLDQKNIQHERFPIGEMIDLELEGARQLMTHLPGGMHLLTLRGDGEFILAIRRLNFLREYNLPK